MNDEVFENDDPRTQKRRIERLVKELNPKLEVEFYHNRVNPKTTDIRFKIYDLSTNRIVCSIKQDDEWASSEVADKGDSNLRQMIIDLINRSKTELASR